MLEYWLWLTGRRGVGLRGLRALCIGEKTAQAARQAGMQVSVSKQATIDSLTELLLEQADSLRLQPADHE